MLVLVCDPVLVENASNDGGGGLFVGRQVGMQAGFCVSAGNPFDPLVCSISSNIRALPMPHHFTTTKRYRVCRNVGGRIVENLNGFCC